MNVKYDFNDKKSIPNMTCEAARKVIAGQIKVKHIVP